MDFHFAKYLILKLIFINQIRIYFNDFLLNWYDCQGFTLQSLCTRSFLQEIQFLPLIRIDCYGCYFPNGITYTFLLISFLSCNIYICYELNDFLLFFLLFSFDEYIIALLFLFVNTFFNFIYNNIFISILICFKTIYFFIFSINFR